MLSILIAELWLSAFKSCALKATLELLETHFLTLLTVAGWMGCQRAEETRFKRKYAHQHA